MLTLYGYKRCSTCRDAQKTLEQNGAQVEFHDVVDHPPTQELVRHWLSTTGFSVMDFVNTKGTVYRERDLKSAHFTDEQWIQELSKDGKLVKRPILVTASGKVFIGYDEGTYRRVALADT